MTCAPSEVSDQPVLSAWRKLGSLATHWAHSEDWSDWVDAQADLIWHTVILLVLSWGSSFYTVTHLLADCFTLFGLSPNWLWWNHSVAILGAALAQWWQVSVVALQSMGAWFNPLLLQSFRWDYKLRSCLQQLIEPPHDRTNKMICVPSKDSGCPGWSESSLWAPWVA